MSDAAVEERMWPSSTAMVVIATTIGSWVAEKMARATLSRESSSLSVEQQRGRPSDHEEEREEERQLQQVDRIVHERVEVELDSAHHEEERDEEAVADRDQLRLEEMHLAALEREADDDPRHKAAEQQVETER